MRVFVVLIIALVLVVGVVGCGGGGSGRITMYVNIHDLGDGFGATRNLELLFRGFYDGDPNGDQGIDRSWGINASGTVADLSINFGAPSSSFTDNRGVGIFEVLVSDDSSAWLWQEHGAEHVLAYAPRDSPDYPGWTIWDIDNTVYEGPARDATMYIHTQFLYAGAGNIAASRAVAPEVLSAKRMSAQEFKIKAKAIAAKYGIR